MLDFEVDDGISDTILDDIHMGTFHAKVEEMVSLGRSVCPTFFAIIVVQAIGLFLISEVLKRNITSSL